MSISAGKGRLLNGSGGDRVKRNNLTEFRGSAWEMVTDYFFGISTVDYGWNDVADEDLLTKWIYTQDGVAVSDHTVVPAKHELDIALTAGPDPISNQREMFTIPETGLWGIAHAVVEIKGEAYEAGMALPQHGLGLRAQEDTKRRAIVAWHDVFIGNPHAINVGVWQGDLDGSNFTNRQGNVSLDLKQIYNITSGGRVGGVVTAVTAAAHGMVVDDYLNISWTREFPGTTLVRASNVVTATLGSGHQLQAGDTVFLFGAGTFSGTHTVTSSNATQATWAQVDVDESGSGNVKDRSSDVRQVQVTEIVDSTTFRYVDGKHDLTNLGTSATANERLFPYWMEARVSGTVIQVRCWSRHQSRPGWTDPYHAFTVDLDKAHRTYTVTASSRTGGISTLTIGAHDFMVGSLITVDVTDAGLDITNGFVTAINDTQVSYDNPGADVGSGGTGTCIRKGGADADADIATIPTPRGSGRIAVAGAHEGIVQLSHVSYGGLAGTNSFDGAIVWSGTGTGTFGFTGVAAGTYRRAGVAAGSFGFTGTATGVPRVRGLAAGAFGFTGVAVGQPIVGGAAVGAFGLTGTAAGTPRVLAAATGVFGFVAGAAGVPYVQGAATGAFGFAGVAAGVTRRLGVGASSFGFTGITSGVARTLGTATAAFGFIATALGVPRVSGAATGVFGFTGAASGVVDTPAVTGQASGLFGFTGTATGQARAIGVGSGSFGFTGTGAGTRKVAATTSGLFSFTGNAFGVPRTRGAATASLGFTGLANGTPRVHGDASGLFGFTGAASGEIPVEAVTGTAVGVFGYTATATGRVTVSAAAAGAFGFSGLAAGTPRVAGVGSGLYGFTATATGKATVYGQALGLFGGMFTAVAPIQTPNPIAATYAEPFAATFRESPDATYMESA
jgi:hypothetical protein